MSEPQEIENLPKIKVDDSEIIELSGTLADARAEIEKAIEKYGPDAELYLNTQYDCDDGGIPYAEVRYEREETDEENLVRTIRHRQEQKRINLVAETIKNMEDSQVYLLGIEPNLLRKAKDYLKNN